jgi:hypothetical protein
MRSMVKKDRVTSVVSSRYTFGLIALIEFHN